MKPYLKIIGLLAFMLLATGLTVNGQLIKAYLEKLSDDPAGAGEGRIYYNTTTKKAMLHNGTAFGPLGAGAGGGSVNYIGSPDSAINWVGLGLTPSTTADPDHLPRAPYDTQALLIETPGTLGTDARARYCFEIGESDKYKILQLSAAVRASSGYLPGEMKFLVRGWTGAACTGFTRPTLLLDEGISKSDFYGEFYADPGFGSGVFENGYASYELSVIASTVDAPEEGDWLALSSITVGPDTRIMGAVTTDDIEFTPTLTGMTIGDGTNWARYRISGGRVEVQGAIIFGSTTSASGPIGVSPPAEFTTEAPGYATVGSARLIDASNGANAKTAIVWRHTDGVLYFNVSAQGNRVSSSAPFTFESGDYISYNYSIPVTELRGKGTTQMLTRGHLYASAKARASMSGTQTISTETLTTVVFDTADFDTQGMLNTSTGEMTCPADGDYSVVSTLRWANDMSAATNVIMYLYKNATFLVRQYFSPSVTPFSMVLNQDIECSAGDVLTVRVQHDAGVNRILSGPTFSSFSVKRISDYTHGTGVGLGLATADDPGLVKKRIEPQTVVVPTSGASTLNVTLTFSLIDNQVTVKVSQTISTVAASDAIETAAGTIPEAFRPVANTAAATVVASGSLAVAGVVRINANGSLIFHKYDRSNFSGSGGAAAAPSSAFTYYLD